MGHRGIDRFDDHEDPEDFVEDEEESEGEDELDEFDLDVDEDEEFDPDLP